MYIIILLILVAGTLRDPAMMSSAMVVSISVLTR
jgi:hypothetical protein